MLVAEPCSRQPIVLVAQTSCHQNGWISGGHRELPNAPFFFVHLQRRATLDMLRSDRCVKTVALVVEDPLRPLLA